MPEEIYDCIIIGGGPAGYAAAVYAGRANMRTLVLAGYHSGGQLMTTTDVEDYPGFPNGIKGPELMKLFRAQAEKFVEKIIDVDVKKVDFSEVPFKMIAEDKEYRARTVIIATGSSPRLLGLASEKKYFAKGVSTCAVCDGFFFKDKDVAVIGGGDTAMREAIYLAKLCKSVTVIHRRDQLRAQAVLQDRAKTDSKIKFAWNSVVDEFLGDGEKLTGIRIRNVETEETSEIKVAGAFVAIGHVPNTDFLKGSLELDKKGYVVLEDKTRTSVPGVFGAGDVQDFVYMQAITAAADGCRAALDAHRFLEEK